MATSIKISQLPAKGSNLEATDLLEVSEFNGTGYVSKSITGAEIVASVPPTSVEWGDIGGTLSSQTDLNTALNGKVPTTRTLTINGTTQDLSADRTFTISTGITIGTTAITSGAVGRVLFEGTGNVVSESANFTYDNTNVLFTLGSIPTRIFTFRPQDTTGAYGNSSSIRGGISNGRLDFYSASNITELKDNIIILTSVGGPSIQVGASSISLNVASSTRLQVAPTTGNVLINTTTDAGYKLDVNGTARINTLTIGLGTGQIATNVVVGFQGLFSNTTGLQNIAIGYQAVYTNTTGWGNVGVGTSSLVFNSTGSGNTAFGDEALLRNTTGGKNIGIGQRAGTYAGSGTASNQTSSDSIYIGYQARASANGATNELVFGKDTVGAGSNSVVLGNTSITKTILRGTLNASGLPTSPTGLASGDLWNDAGTLKIV